MSEVLEQCTVCQGILDEEDLFCANCGTEAPHGEQNREEQDHLPANLSFMNSSISATHTRPSAPWRSM